MTVGGGVNDDELEEGARIDMSAFDVGVPGTTMVVTIVTG